MYLQEGASLKIVRGCHRGPGVLDNDEDAEHDDAGP